MLLKLSRSSTIIEDRIVQIPVSEKEISTEDAGTDVVTRLDDDDVHLNVFIEPYFGNKRNITVERSVLTPFYQCCSSFYN